MPAISAFAIILKLDSFVHEFCPKGDGIGVVDGEHSNCRASGLCQTEEHRSPPAKVARPLLMPRMEQRHNLAALRINSGHVGAFMFVAVEATPREIFEDRLAPVLLSNNMIDLKRRGIKLSRHLAVLAAITSLFADLPQQLAVHGRRVLAGRAARSDRRAFDCRIPSVCPTLM